MLSLNLLERKKIMMITWGEKRVSSGRPWGGSRSWLMLNAINHFDPTPDPTYHLSSKSLICAEKALQLKIFNLLKCANKLKFNFMNSYYIFEIKIYIIKNISQTGGMTLYFCSI